MAMERAARQHDATSCLQAHEPSRHSARGCSQPGGRDHRRWVEPMVSGRDRGCDQGCLARSGQPCPAQDRPEEHTDVVQLRTTRVQVHANMQVHVRGDMQVQQRSTDRPRPRRSSRPLPERDGSTRHPVQLRPLMVHAITGPARAVWLLQSPAVKRRLHRSGCRGRPMPQPIEVWWRDAASASATSLWPRASVHASRPRIGCCRSVPSKGEGVMKKILELICCLLHPDRGRVDLDHGLVQQGPRSRPEGRPGRSCASSRWSRLCTYLPATTFCLAGDPHKHDYSQRRLDPEDGRRMGAQRRAVIRSQWT